MPSGVYKRTDKNIENMSKSHLGNKPWNIGKKCPKTSGKNHWRWLGSKVGYSALHSWIKRNLGTPRKCEHCGDNNKNGSKQYQWANKDHKYKRNLEDWIRLCTSCHRKYDYINFN